MFPEGLEYIVFADSVPYLPGRVCYAANRHPPGLKYIAAFFGRLYAEMIAVPAYPPDPSRFSRSLPRLQGMVADAQATIALTTEAILNLEDKDQC